MLMPLEIETVLTCHFSFRRKKRSVRDMDVADDGVNDVDTRLLTALEAQELVDNLETFLTELGFRLVDLRLI